MWCFRPRTTIRFSVLRNESQHHVWSYYSICDNCNVYLQCKVNMLQMNLKGFFFFSRFCSLVSGTSDILFVVEWRQQLAVKCGVLP